MDSASIKSGINAYKTAQSMAPKGAGAADGAAGLASLNGPKAGEESFGDFLNSTLQKAQGVGYAGEKTSLDSIAKKASPVDLVTAVSQAELTLQTVVAVRDRIINAYQDIVKMPI